MQGIDPAATVCQAAAGYQLSQLHAPTRPLPLHPGAQVDAYEYLEGMQALLEELRSAGVEMHAMSNYPQWYRRVDEKLGLHRRAPKYVEPVLLRTGSLSKQDLFAHASGVAALHR